MIIPEPTQSNPARQAEFLFEEWRVIADAPDYEISSHGRLRRATNGKNTSKGRILNPVPDKDGYLQFTATVDKKRRVIKIHRAVLLAFKGCPPTDGHLGSHEDGDVSNNLESNLEWRTQKKNLELRFRHGTNGKTLTKKSVVLIHSLRSEGMTYDEIAVKCCVSKSAVAHVIKGRCWAYDNS